VSHLDFLIPLFLSLSARKAQNIFLGFLTLSLCFLAVNLTDMTIDQKNQFAFFSANLHQYIPDLPWAAHHKYFRQYHHYHQPKAIPVNSKSKVNGYCPNEPGILATFHLGNHTQLPVALVDAGFLFDILIDQPTYDRYRKPLELANRRLVAKGNDPIRFLLSEDRNLFFKIRESIRRGRHMLIFADGNGGQDNNDLKKDLLPIPFFSGILWVKKGIPVLSRLLKIPTYPLLSTIEDHDQILEFCEPIFTDSRLNRLSDAERVLNHLYRLLFLRIAHDPMQWECWLYLHRNGMLKIEDQAINLPEKPDLYAEYIDTVRIGRQVFLFDKKKYYLFRSV